MENSFKQQIVKTFLQHNILVSDDFLNEISEDFNAGDFMATLKKHEKFDDLLFVNKSIKGLIEEKISVQWKEVEKIKAISEKRNTDHFSRVISDINSDNNSDNTSENNFDNNSNKEKAEENSKKEIGQILPVKVLSNFEYEGKKTEVKDFVNYYKNRFEYLKKIMCNRPDLTSLLSISKVLAKKEKENISIIGMVVNKLISKNKNIILTLEDNTGEITVIVNQSKKEIYNIAKSIVFDEVIGVNGVNSNKVIFVNKIILPEVILNKELKKSPKEEYAVFLSDIHIGSNNFLEDKFNKFIKWLNGEIKAGSEIAAKIKYLFIIGDLVDGVGIYPGQDKELIIKDIYEQYNEFSRYMKKIPGHINIIISPGNHDAVRMSEPQPKISEEYIGDVAKMKNVTLVTNPAYVNIAASEGFPGFDILMYHGYSFDYYIANVDEIRNKGGYDRADLVMKFLLQKRHLSPAHTSSLFLPFSEEPQLIKSSPDFFVTGHIHKTSVSSHNNITLISGSCWQSTTAFQEKVGHNPEPARVPLVNLKTREIKILKF